ncbi:MAG: hypothetical protein K8R13_11250 [Methanococcoides sp.]|nr:hypothetical protein [Methanococcoides sp.]
MIITDYIILLTLIGLVVAYLNKHSMIFTFVFIVFITVSVYRLTDDYVSVALTVAGLIFAHHSVQPFFYPIAVKNESKERYLTCMYENGKVCPFDKTEDVHI